jgi:hypothetical protein
MNEPLVLRITDDDPRLCIICGQQYGPIGDGCTEPFCPQCESDSRGAEVLAKWVKAKPCPIGSAVIGQRLSEPWPLGFPINRPTLPNSP